MNPFWTRRTFAGTAGAASLAAAQESASRLPTATKTVKILGVSCSPRKDRGTAAVMRVCLEAAKGVGPDIEVELIDLAGLKMNGDLAAGIAAKLQDPSVGGIIVGTPVYFSNMTSLCKAFLDRWMAFRPTFALRNKVGGAIAVGAARNGGQELTLQTIHAALLCQDMLIVSEGRPSARLGGIVVSAQDDVSKDTAGLETARSLGRRVAEVALLMRKSGS